MKVMLFVMVMRAVALVIDASLAPDQVQSGVSISPTIMEVPPNRLLRTDTTERNNEERTIPGLSNLKTWLTPSLKNYQQQTPSRSCFNND
ncbi:RxLR effector protein [Phytophthora megakarya]|uniref:RxLR effector protein n=1 Tax=Phytophthora megakarya TaxID=4795 RepID=A0A225V187_9STRA|nr:RxLR effector protein [Phytophthora megakarya]